MLVEVTDKLDHIMLYNQADFTSRFKHMYHTIMTTMVPKYTWFRLHPLNFCNIVAILKESNFPESLMQTINTCQ